MQNLSSFLQEYITSTEAFFEEKVFRKVKLHTPNYAALVDDHTNRTDGYSFVTDERNDLNGRKKDLLWGLTEKTGPHTLGLPGSPSELDPIACRHWMTDCEQGLELLFNNMFLTWGGPARGPELRTIGLYNTGGRRSIHWLPQYKLIAIVTWYHKSESTTGRESMVLRALPPQLSHLLVLYLAYVIPTLSYIANHVMNTEAATTYKTYLFTSFGTPWNTNKFSTILRKATKSWCGHALGIQQWRHTAKAIARQYLSTESRSLQELLKQERNSSTTVMDAQSAHTTQIALDWYAASRDVLAKMPGALQTAFISFSHAWFNHFGLDVAMSEE
jgi:hypothetical protein